MATFEKRLGKTGKITWRVRVRRQIGPWLTKSFARKSDAQEWARSVEHKIDAGEHVPNAEARKRTLGDAIKRYLEITLPRSKHRKNESEQTRLLNWWNTKLGQRALVSLTPSMIAEVRDELSKGRTRDDEPLSGATVNRYLTALSAVLRVTMREYGWINRNPVSNVTRLEDSKGRERFLSEEERLELLKACDAFPMPALSPIVRLALATGARKSELLGLQWADVDLKRRTARFLDTKNGDSRTVTLAATAVETLKSWKEDRLPKGAVFPYPAGAIDKPRRPRARRRRSTTFASMTSDTRPRATSR